MAVAYRSHAATTSGALNTPAGVQVRDVLLALVESTTPPTPPAGWTLVGSVSTGGTSADRNTHVYVYPVTSTPPATHTFSPSLGGLVVAYLGGDPADPIDSYTTGADGGSTLTGISAPSVETTVENTLLAFFAVTNYAGTTWTPPSGMTERFDGNTNMNGVLAADQPQEVAGASGGRTATASAPQMRPKSAFLIALRPDPNVAPNAPTLVSPVGGVSINLAATQRFSWTFSDPNPGDTQSKFDLRYRPAAGGTWTDITQTTPNNFYDLPAATLTAGDYEWQVRTYDALGVVGPYSSSAFFTAATTPPGPTITDPINGQTIPSADYTGTISYPDMDSWEWRVLGDDGGVPDESNVIIPATTRPSTTRTFHMQGLPNGVTVHPQVRVLEGGLWSQWVSSSNPVSFTPPAVPSVAVWVDNLAGAIRLQATHPEPDGGQPAVVAVDWWRRRLLHDADGLVTGYDPAEGGEAGIPLARGASQPPAAMWTDWQVASGAEYAYRARARGDNDTSTFSAWSDVVTWDSDVVTWDSDVVTWN